MPWELYGAERPVADDMARQRCSCCGKHRQQVTGLATSAGSPAGKFAADATICADCLILCREIHAERLA